MDEHNVVINISNALGKLITEVRPFRSTCCIYRVPSLLRRANKIAYTPMVVSIGPLHHGNDKSLQMMEETKMRFLKNFIERPNVSLRECVKIVKEREESLRGCYQETFGFEDDDFVKIILVDAIFIVELFLTRYWRHLELPVGRERVLDAKLVLKEVREDFLLLENQLPFFILEDIWKCATEKSINEIFYRYFSFGSGLDLDLNSDDGIETIINSKPEHFVDLVRKLHIPLNPKPTGRLKTFQTPRVTELRKAGVKFNVNESSKRLCDVSFSKGILKIPKWKILDETEVRFRNLVAYEQCHCELKEAYICHYISLMDYLVNTSEDVDFLVKKKILENWLGDSNDVSSMINKLGIGVSISTNHFYFADIFNDLNKHCEIPRNKWMANLKQNYFKTPWTIISFCAALLLLILTFTQTVCSIISLKN